MYHKGRKLFLNLGTFIGISVFYILINSTNSITYTAKGTENAPTVASYSTISSLPGLIQLDDINGNSVLRKIQNKNWNEPPIKWNPREEVLAFIHIGKSGGTSMEKSLRKGVLVENNCMMKCSNYIKQLQKDQPNCPGIKPMLCHGHFDWTAIQRGEEQGHKMAPIILLRDPIERVVSHFYYARKLSWTEGKKIRKQTLGEYLNDRESMMDTYSIWHDGQVGIYNCS